MASSANCWYGDLKILDKRQLSLKVPIVPMQKTKRKQNQNQNKQKECKVFFGIICVGDSGNQDS